MKTLKRIVGEMILATACGAIVGGAFGYSVEAVREGLHEDERGENSYLGRYVMDKKLIAGGAALGSAVAATIYLLRGREERRDDNEEGKV
jgi:hypothetical protein